MMGPFVGRFLAPGARTIFGSAVRKNIASSATVPLRGARKMNRGAVALTLLFDLKLVSLPSQTAA